MGFTLIELLVVIAIIALLVSILLPSLSTARTLAKILTAHAELRGVTISLGMYRQEHEALPPTRFSCSTQVAYELPPELADGGYLPGREINGVQVAYIEDPFVADQSFRYRAVGHAILNETTHMPNGGTLWVPDGFGRTETDTGQYYNDPRDSPVRYAVWSWGPEPASKKFDIPGRAPVPQKYWLRNAQDEGVITHMEIKEQRIVRSP